MLRLFTSLVVAALVVVVGAGPIACGADDSGTGGRRITLDVDVAVSPTSRQFTNARGWSVSITKALVATGPLYFYDGETLFASARPPAPAWSPERAARAWSFMSVRAAHAHPGHYVPGNAKGEMLTPSSAELLAGGRLGTGDGVSGVARSATFSFATPAAGPLAAELGGNVAVLEGSASKGAEHRTFRVELRPDDVVDANGALEVIGCPFTAADMLVDGTVTVTVDLSRWFDNVAFEDVPPSADGSRVLLGEGLARSQLVRGVKGALSYVFSYSAR